MSVYLITGGANGAGAEIALRLHGDGHSILFADIERITLPGVRSVICDLADEGQVASLLFGVEAVEGKLDGLICHAAPNGAEDDFAGTGLLINAAAGLLRRGQGAALAIDTGRTAALPALTSSLARELGPDIRVGCIAPFHPEKHFASLTAYLAG